MSAKTQTYRFEAEVQEVLNLVVHSLYTQRDIFLRELVSNASDALDKLRFEALTRPELLPEGDALGVAIEVDRKTRRLRVADNGIGMSRGDLVENLGRIASSGTRRFLEALRADESAVRAATPELIGQFGVGFYASFMVADRVVVETRRAGSDEAWRWTSSGGGEYEIEEATELERGTVVTLHVKEGSEFDDLLSEWKIREIVARYSDFVEYPIQMEIEREETPRDDSGDPIEGAKPALVRRTETLNSMKPLWARPKEDVTPEEYAEFYKHLTHDWNDPLEPIHFHAEGALEYTALLYLPKERPLDLFDPTGNRSRVALYVRRVLVQKESEALLPVWLRFVRGVVECSDLALNVSRESLQEDPRVRRIQKRLVRKVLETCKDLLDGDRRRYEQFWSAFGGVLKEGLYYGEDEDQRISSLCLFESSRGPGWTTLSEYVERMPVSQKAIWILLGSDRETLEKSPHLEGPRSKGQEVLLLSDPVDEWVVQRFREFEGKPLRRLEQGDLELDAEPQRARRKEREKEFAELLEAMRAALPEELSEVRFSSRLRESPAVLVSEDEGLSPQLLAAMRRAGRDVPEPKRVLELNPDHALVGGLKKLFDVDPKTPRVQEVTEILHGQALLAEGGTPRDPARFSKLVTELVVGSLASAPAGADGPRHST